MPWAMLLVLVILTPLLDLGSARCADARATVQRHEPSKGQLSRLERYEPYIR